VTGPYTQLSAFSRVYYILPPTKDLSPVQPFPKGLRILVGSPNNKVATSSHTWTCHSNAGDIINSSFNFDNVCENGVATTVYYPNCWDGINLYSDDSSHIVYPNGGVCPASNPIAVPRLQLEYQYATNKYRPGVKVAGHLMLSNGDTTGFGQHADFVEGWDQDVLAAALKDPSCNTGDAQ
jgi:hypothetical protein